MFDYHQSPERVSLDPPATVRIETRLQEIEAKLDAANRGTAVTHPDQLEDEVNSVLTQLGELLPEAWQQTNNDADFDVIATVLDRMESAVAAGAHFPTPAATFRIGNPHHHSTPLDNGNQP